MRVAFIHTAAPAIAPLMQFYGAHAPEFEIVNLLDDGIIRSLRAGKPAFAVERLRDLVRIARDAHKVEAAMVTCSSVTQAMAAALEAEFGLPVLKIDVPMAARAVRAGRRIGVVITATSTVEPTTKLLNDAAADAGVQIELVPAVISEAYEALLGGRLEEHDALLLSAMDRLVAEAVDVIVLAQVSMARLLPQVEGRYSVPVLSSLETSLEELRATFERSRA